MAGGRVHLFVILIRWSAQGDPLRRCSEPSNESRSADRYEVSCLQVRGRTGRRVCRNNKPHRGGGDAASFRSRRRSPPSYRSTSREPRENVHPPKLHVGLQTSRITTRAGRPTGTHSREARKNPLRREGRQAVDPLLGSFGTNVAHGSVTVCWLASTKQRDSQNYEDSKLAGDKSGLAEMGDSEEK
jgi:hypothetical protein